MTLVSSKWSVNIKHVSKSFSPGPLLSVLKLQRNVWNYWLEKKMYDFEKFLLLSNFVNCDKEQQVGHSHLSETVNYH